MPIVRRESRPPSPLDMTTGNLPNPQVEESPGVFETIGAAFRTDNVIGSGLAAEGYDGTYDISYNPWDDITNTHYAEHWDVFAASRSKDMTDALKRQVDREAKDRETLQAAGALGVLASIGSTLVDPTILIPVGGTVKKIEGGYSILRSAANIGATSGLAIAAQEGILQGQQELRTPDESIINIGGGIVLGGILGTGAAKLLSRSEARQAQAGYDTLVTGELHTGGGLSAAETSKLTIGDLTVDGRDAQAVAKATQALSPNLRLQQSPSVKARALGQQVAEGSMYQTLNTEGKSLGPAVETLVHVDMNRRISQGLTAQSQAYKEMRRAGTNMSWREFDEAVGEAMRNNDQGINSHISQAAAAWRKSVADPYFQDLVRAGLLKEDDKAAFAASYFPRRYNVKAMIANEPQIKSQWTAFMERRIADQFAAAKQAKLGKEGRLTEKLNDLTLSAEDRAVLIEELEATKAATLDDSKVVKRIESRLENLRKGLVEDGLEVPEGSLLSRSSRSIDQAATAAARTELEAALKKIDEQFYETWEVRRLGQGLEGADVSFSNLAREIVDDVFDRITAKNYGDSSSIEPEYQMPIKRGPVLERTLPIPDEMLNKQGVLLNSAQDVLTHFARVAGADAHLTDLFGSPTLVKQMEEIKEEYRALREAAGENPKELARLNKRENQDINDLRALRDLVRGNYKAAENASNWGRLSRAVNHFNYIRAMGGVVVSSLGDLYRPAMVHGLGKFMSEGVAPLINNLDAVKMSVKEAQLAGTVVERVLQHRVMQLAEMGDPYGRGNVVERMLENGSRFASKWNGITWWTDGIKSISAILSQNRILDPKANARTMAFLGADSDMHRKIIAQFEEHGEVIDGVRVANTERWTDPQAVSVFRAMVNKDVNSTIVTPSLGDSPLISKTPLGRMLLQFKSFMFASHQKVLLRGLQEDKTNFLSGMVGLTALGMLASTLRAWRGGEGSWEKFKRNSENPGFMIAEGLDNTGIFSVPFEVGNTTERLSPSVGFRFNPVKTPIIYGGTLLNPDAPSNTESVKAGFQSPWGALLGPTGGMGDQAFRAAGGAASLARGDEVSPGSVRAAAGLLPFNSYLGMREMLQVLNDDSPYEE